MDKTYWKNLDVRLCAVAASLLLSLYTFLLADIPNDDAYTYIRAADIFREQSVGAAISHYTWAGYPILIGLLSSIGIPLFAAAHLINALLFALIVFSFISIVQTIDDSKPIVWLSALTVLVFPELNEYREMVIRDIGFWAFSLLGLWQFMLFYRDRELKQGVLFCIALSLAMLFRVEAILYLAFTPLSLLLDKRQESSTNQAGLLHLYSVIAALSVVGFVALLIAGINLFGLLVEFISVYQPFLANALNPSEADVAAMGNAIFGEYASTFSRQYVTAVIAVGLLVVLFMNVFYAISGPYFWLLVYAWLRKRLAFDSQQLKPVLVYLLINAVILFVFLYITRYLTSRYAVLLALMVAVQVPFVIQRIVEAKRDTKWERFGTQFLVLFFVYCAIDSYVSFGKPKDWLLDSASYISESVQSTNSVLTNNHTIAYFSGEVENYDEVLRMLTVEEVARTNPGDIIAIELFYEMTVLVENPEVAPYLQQLAVFPTEGEPRVGIYRRSNY